MPLKLSELLNKTKKITIDFDGSELEIEYKIGFYTPAVAASSDKDMTLEERFTRQIEIMADAIVSWNLEDDKEKSIPVSTDVIEKFSTAALNVIFSEMVEGTRPNPKT